MWSGINFFLYPPSHLPIPPPNPAKYYGKGKFAPHEKKR